MFYGNKRHASSLLASGGERKTHHLIINVSRMLTLLGLVSLANNRQKRFDAAFLCDLAHSPRIMRNSGVVASWLIHAVKDSHHFAEW